MTIRPFVFGLNSSKPTPQIPWLSKTTGFAVQTEAPSTPFHAGIAKLRSFQVFLPVLLGRLGPVPSSMVGGAYYSGHIPRQTRLCGQKNSSFDDLYQADMHTTDFSVRMHHQVGSADEQSCWLGLLL